MSSPSLNADNFYCILEAPDYRFVEVSANYLEYFGLPKTTLGMAFRDLPTLSDKCKHELIQKLDNLIKTNTPFLSWDEATDMRTGKASLVRWINIGFTTKDGYAFRIKCVGKLVRDRRKAPRDACLQQTGSD